MIDSLPDRDPLEVLVEEFASRCRQRESPSISEYVSRYPLYGKEIEELFPTVAMMEQLRCEEKANRAAAARQSASATPPRHIGDFDIIQEIGRGGMGVVYEAEQRSLGRRVAVKVLPKHVFLLDRHVKRFQREAQTAARLHHTNIVPVFGVGDQNGLHYYVMQLIRGVGLDEIIWLLRGMTDSPAKDPDEDPDADEEHDDTFADIRELVRTLTMGKFSSAQSGTCVERPADNSDGHENGRRRKLTVPTGAPADRWLAIARIGIQAAEALNFAHGQGTLHRDIKPANLLVDEDGVVRVADFGLARAVEQPDAGCGEEIVGTLRYMAPEQLRGVADARSDVYALGLTLYEMLTLRPAFDDSARGGRDQRRPPPAPRSVNPAIPRDLETIVLKCLAEEPSKRYPTAAALAADLRRFLDDRPVRARRISSVERVWRWCRRNPALAATSALSAVLLVVAAATALGAYVNTRRAYAETKTALAREEATSLLALDVLEDIYLQLSPDRAGIPSDSDPGGEACACVGLRSSAGSASPAQRNLMQVQASRETAGMLENLLVFYDRLAEQAGDDSRVMLESAIASRRVGDIRGRLGQINHAEEEYAGAVKKLTALRGRLDSDELIHAELARCHNAIGNVRSAKLEYERAHEAHQDALSILQSVEHTDGLPAYYQYERARTLYFLSSTCLSEISGTRGRQTIETVSRRRKLQHDSKRYRKSAVGILEKLTGENSEVPDYRFLLALCHRPPGTLPAPTGASSDVRGRERAIRILEKLTAEYPGIADYRYELIATYAWIHVSVFPWQGNFAVSAKGEGDLRKALDESRLLVTRNPTNPHYACSEALILAKLGTVCLRTRRLKEAADLFQRALQTQGTVVAEFRDLPSHNQVLREFLRLRLGQIRYQCGIEADDPRALMESRGLLETCVENLTGLTARPELATDRLALNSLPAARRALSDVLVGIGDRQKTTEAGK